MKSKVPSSWHNILQVVMRQPDHTLDELMPHLQLDRSTVHRHLAAMAEAGWVTVQGERRNRRYAPREQVEVAWNARLGPVWRHLEWRAGAPIDWRRPLLSRVPDADARKVVGRLLDAMDVRRLLHPASFIRSQFRHGTFRDVWKSWDEEIQREFDARLDEGAYQPPITAIVFGSCARGDARPESDVDLMVIAPHSFGPPIPTPTPSSIRHPVRPPRADEALQRRFETTLESQLADQPLLPLKQALQDLVADVNLGATRPIDLVHVESQATTQPSLRQAVAREGITVFSTGDGSDFVEAWSRAQ